MQDNEGIGLLFEKADGDATDRLLFENVGKVSGEAPDKEAERVANLFCSPLGQQVLEDLHKRFVYVTIVEPGQPPEVHGIRQGQANVVFHLVDMIAKARS